MVWSGRAPTLPASEAGIQTNLFNEELRAAQVSLPFEHPKLTAVAMVGKEDMAAALERARRQTQKVIEARPVDVIEPPKEEPEAQVELPDHSSPFAHDNKSRWRRF